MGDTVAGIWVRPEDQGHAVHIKQTPKKMACVKYPWAIIGAGTWTWVQELRKDERWPPSAGEILQHGALC